MRSIIPVNGQLLFGLQVVVGEHIQIGFKRLRRQRIATKRQTHGRDF